MSKRQALRREWDLKLKARAKGELFNVFHNKSDDFLDAVAEKRLQIIGPPVDGQWTDYLDFDRSTTLQLSPDLLVWSTGYRSHLPDLSGGVIQLKDFYHGCVHTGRHNLFLIGFHAADHRQHPIDQRNAGALCGWRALREGTRCPRI